jgi:acyl dehydratase
MAKKILYYKDIEKGKEFPNYEYKLTAETILNYCKAIGEKSPIYNDEAAAKAAGYRGLVAPPTACAIYCLKGFLGDVDMPGGSLHGSQEFEFVNPAVAGDTLITSSVVGEKAIIKGRNNATIVSETKNQNGEVIVRSKMGGIWAE